MMKDNRRTLRCPVCARDVEFYTVIVRPKFMGVLAPNFPMLPYPEWKTDDIDHYPLEMAALDAGTGVPRLTMGECLVPSRHTSGLRLPPRKD